MYRRGLISLHRVLGPMIVCLRRNYVMKGYCYHFTTPAFELQAEVGFWRVGRDWVLEYHT